MVSRLKMLVIAVAVAVPFVLCSGSARAGELAPLALEEPATTMAMTEDGAFLLVGHEAAGKLTVWDVKAGKQAKVISCPSPRHVLCRGGKVYVANFGKGTVSVIDPAGDWSPSNQLLVGINEVYYLSAPGGKNFKGQIVASCGKYTEKRFILLETDKDKPRQVGQGTYDSVATFSYDGNSIIKQSEFSHSPAATVEALPAAEFLSGGRGSLGRGKHEDTEFLWQVREEAFWLGQHTMYAGMPPKRFGNRMGTLIFPDLTRPVIYVLDGEQIAAHQVCGEMPKIGSATITYSPKYAREKEVGNLRYNYGRPSYGKYLFHTPLAATFDKTTHLFTINENARLLFHCALEMNVAAVAAAGSPGPSGSPGAYGAENFPARVVTGVPVSFPLYGKEIKGTFTVMNGPKGLTVSEKGVIGWTPDAADAGPQGAKIKAEVDGQVSFLRLSTEVVSKELADKVGGDMSRLGNLGVHIILQDRYDLSVSLDGQSVMLLAGRGLSILDADGLTVRKNVELKSSYLRIAERAEGYVALASDSLDILDKGTLDVKKRIPLPGSGASDMALNPVRRETYVAVFDNEGGKVNNLEAKRVVAVNENAGTVRMLPRVFGQWLAVHPSGKILYTALRDMYRAGYRIDWYIGEVMPDYGNIDILVSYDISDNGVQHRQSNLSPGANGRAMRMAPDGAHVSYVSGGGYRSGAEKLNGYTVPAFTADDVRVAKVSYKTDAYPIDVSYHPFLGLAAACNEKEVRIFDRRSGEILAGKVELKDTKLAKIQRVFFAPGGGHLLIDSDDQSGKRALRAFALRLSEDERRELAARPRAAVIPVAPVPAPTPAQPVAPTPKKPASVPLAALEALGGARAAPMDAKEIARQFMDAVVVIKSDDRSGTGFVVGGKGYVLTCAHVIPPMGDVTVSYRKREGETVTLTAVRATVINVDDKRDLALLKIELPKALPVVRLETAGKMETGEQVSVIGNPGLGEKILDYTMTQGIVSSPQRTFDGQTYVQTSATINPGCSGGPMFNSRGNVVGLAVLKARIENTGFAVPAGDLVAFLKSCADVSSSAPPPAAPDSRTPEQICAGWLNMAENFRANRAPDKAREYLQKIIDTYPNTEGARKAREILKGL